MEEFLKQLDSSLKQLPAQERQDILRDHEEMIRDAMAAGKSEVDAVLAFGDPRSLAKALVATSLVDRSSLKGPAAKGLSYLKQLVRATFAVAALAPFNLIFVFGPFLVLVGCLLAAWAVVGGVVLSFIALLVGVGAESIRSFSNVWAALSGGLLSLAGIFFGLAGCIIMAWITMGFAKVTHAYLKWNLSLVVPITSKGEGAP